MADNKYTIQDLQDNLNYLNDTKTLIKQAITNKGQEVSEDDTFRSYANKIEAIETGVDTSDATATPNDLLAPKTAYANGQKIEGSIIPTYRYKGVMEIKPSVTNNTSYLARAIIADKYILLSNSSGNSLYIYNIINNATGNLLVSVTLSDLGMSGTLKDADMADTAITGTTDEYYIALIADTGRGYTSKVLRVNLTDKTYKNCGGNNYGYGFDKVDGNQLRFYSNSSNHYSVVTYSKYGYSNTVHFFTYNINETTDNITALSEQAWSIDNWGSYGCSSGSLLTLSGDYACVQSIMTLGSSYNNYSNCLFKIDWKTNTISTLISATRDKLCLLNEYVIKNNVLYSLSNVSKAITTLSNYIYDKAYGIAVGYNDSIVSFSPTDHLYYIYNLSEDYELSLVSSNSYVSDNRFLIDKGNLCVPKFNRTGLFFTLSNSTGGNINRLEYNINSKVPISFSYSNNTLINTIDATAIAADILINKTAYANDNKVTGSMPNNGALSYIPSDSEQSIPLGYTSGGTVAAADITKLNDYKSCLRLTQEILGGER